MNGGSSGNLPPGFQNLLEPRPFRNISELMGIMANVLITAERSQDNEIKLRYMNLFDVVMAGLTSYVDKEFYSPGSGAKPLVLPFYNAPIELPEILEEDDQDPEDDLLK